MALYFFHENHRQRIGRIGKIALFLDFDGTLVPIRKEPGLCYLTDSIKRELNALLCFPSIRITILTGRSLSDIKRRVGIKNIYYGGNHGVDIWGPDIRFTHPDAERARQILKRIKRELDAKFRGIDGVFIEDKKYSLTIHYRAAGREKVSSILSLFYRTAGKLIKEYGLDIIKGKSVLEIFPTSSWNKGRAALWLLSKLSGGFFPIYIGDDITDESAFSALRNRGITVCVGRSKQTFADYYIKSQREMVKFLQFIRKYHQPDDPL